MSVDLTPASLLEFYRPFTSVTKKTLTLRNGNATPVAFKVKTTAPKQYCVRPNAGRIEAGNQVELQVLLQPMKEDPPSGTKCRDKFLIQSFAITADQETLPLNDLWTGVENGDKSAMHSTKIKCAWMPSKSDDLSKANGHALSHNATPSSHSVSSVTQSPSADDYSSPSTPLQHVRQIPSPNGSKNQDDPVSAATTPSNIAVTNNSNRFMDRVSQTTGVPSDEIRQQLSEAQAYIKRLEQQLKEGASGLRNRAADLAPDQLNEATAKMEQGVQKARRSMAQKGVPLHYVAYLCLAAFLLAYLFF